MHTKYKGIDERKIKSCDKSPEHIESGISFKVINGENRLIFYYTVEEHNVDGSIFYRQIEKSMSLNAENTEQLIEELQKLDFDLSDSVKLLLLSRKVYKTFWQLCPKCNGNGDLLRYNSPSIQGTNAKPIFDVCEGEKIISIFNGLPPSKSNEHNL